MSSMAKMDPSKAEDFAKSHGMTHGDFIASKNLGNTVEDVVLNSYDRFKASKQAVDDALESIDGTFKDQNVTIMASEAFKHAKEATTFQMEQVPGEGPVNDETTGPSSSIRARMAELYSKAKSTGLTMPEINEVKRYYEQNNSMGYRRDNHTIGIAKATKLDGDVREFQIGAADKAGFTNLRDMNKQTQAYHAIVEGVGEKAVKREGNNLMSVTDHLALIADPRA